MKTILKAVLVALNLVVLLGIGLVGALLAWQWRGLHERAEQLERLVAVSWGPGEAREAFYGAYVFPRAELERHR